LQFKPPNFYKVVILAPKKNYKRPPKFCICGSFGP